MQTSIQTTTPTPHRRHRVPHPDFVLRDPDGSVTAEHMLTDVKHDDKGKLLFTFYGEGDEVVLTFKPIKADFSMLMDSVKRGTLGVGRSDVEFRGAVQQAFHSAVIAAHYRSLKNV